jgi:Leucine-rich repeat (LRR) protein
MKSILGIASIALSLMLSRPGYSGIAEFVQLCEAPGLQEGTRSTFKALSKMAFNTFFEDEPIDCKALGAALQKVKAIHLPGQTFHYYFVADLSPVALLDHVRELNIEDQKVWSLDPLRDMRLESLNIKGIHRQLGFLSRMDDLKSLTLTAYSDSALDLLSVLNRLERLEIETIASEPVDFRTVPPMLKNLVMEGSGFRDVKALGQLSLESLDMNGVSLRDLKWLSNSSNRLKFITVFGGAIADVSEIGNLKALRSLRIESTPLKDIAFVAGARGLEHLTLRRNGFWDLGPVAQLQNLKELNVGGNFISDAGPTSQLFKLEKLELRSNRLYRFSMGYMERLKVLDLIENKLQYPPIADVGDAQYRLEELYLSRNEMRSLDTQLGRFTNLKILALSGNDLRDISSLGKLSKLEELDLRSNKIADVSSLSPLSALKVLALGDNVLPIPVVCPVQPASVCVQ